MISKQRSDCVERSVMSVLHKRFKSRLQFDTDLDYVKFDIKPAEYSSVDSFKRDYVLVSFLRKWKGLDTNIDLEGVTFDGWKAAEHQCFRTNRRLEFEATTGFYSIAPSIISDAQRKISQILGRFSFDRIERLCRFGKGATYDLRRGSDLVDKMSSCLTVTDDCYDFAIRAISGDLLWQQKEFSFDSLEVVRGNRMITVPKSAKTHRMISAEPTMNGFVQQSVGRFIRMRLKQAGVDLDDQTINQDLAFAAQVDGLSTIDLSSASDTLCISLVKLLLPPDWFEALDAMRSKFSSYRGRWYRLEKFSSMGNAYTFELESLIFWALCECSKTKPENTLAVYGDDIVTENEDFGRVKETLTWAGFSFNESKSFTAPSRFYESCGKHYYDLEDVTPPFQKDVCSDPGDFIRLHNRLWRASVRLKLVSEFIDARRVVIDAYRERFPRAPVPYGPDVEGDRFFIDPDYDWAGRDRVRLTVYDRIARERATDEYAERYLLAYKLRDRSFSNIRLDGRAARRGSESHVFKKAWIWRSAQL